MLAEDLLTDFPSGYNDLEKVLEKLLSNTELTSAAKLCAVVGMLKALLQAGTLLAEKSIAGNSAVGCEADVFLQRFASTIAGKAGGALDLTKHWDAVAKRACDDMFAHIRNGTLKCVKCNASTHSVSTCKQVLAHQGFTFVGQEKAVANLSKPMGNRSHYDKLGDNKFKGGTRGGQRGPGGPENQSGEN
jgi:hypothetical protein